MDGKTHEVQQKRFHPICDDLIWEKPSNDLRTGIQKDMDVGYGEDWADRRYTAERRMQRYEYWDEQAEKLFFISQIDSFHLRRLK